MNSLVEAKCIPCKGSEPTVTEKEMADLKSKVPKWNVLEENGVRRLN